MRILHLADNEFNDHIAQLSLGFKHLDELYLGYNGITDIGARLLLPNIGVLRALDLSGSTIRGWNLGTRTIEPENEWRIV